MVTLFAVLVAVLVTVLTASYGYGFWLQLLIIGLWIFGSIDALWTLLILERGLCLLDCVIDRLHNRYVAKQELDWR